MPKVLYVVEQDADQATHIGHSRIREVVVRTDDPTRVGVYRLVEEREYICVDAVRRTDAPKRKARK